ncbi:MAG: rhodanese-like domain-containing protein [Rhodocyclaceae bacterium]|nr:rhodanese-like domain-containing protein [Rhodocyclaceae bacterium]
MEFLQQNWHWAALAVASGSMLLFQMIKGKSPDELNPVEATLKINREDAVVVDVRTADEYVKGHIPNARNIPLGDLEKRSGELLKSGQPLILCCATGARSTAAMGTLRKAGATTVFNLAGGIGAWERAGHPLAKGKKKR